MDAASQEPRPRYCVQRLGGVYVPLVALDELPDTVRIANVPRFMSISDLSGMAVLGKEEAASIKKYTVDTSPFHSPLNLPVAEDQRSKKRMDSELRGCGAQLDLAALNIAVMENTEPKDIGLQDSKYSRMVRAEAQEAVESIKQPVQLPRFIRAKRLEVTQDDLAEPQAPSKAPTPRGNKREKVYCTHWIHYGECDYTQVGCKYKHVMPDRDGLRKLGFKDVPKWWQRVNRQRRNAIVSIEHSFAQHAHQKSNSESTTSNESTDTGSLHLGNPDSKRFERKSLPKKTGDDNKSKGAASSSQDEMQGERIEEQPQHQPQPDLFKPKDKSPPARAVKTAGRLAHSAIRDAFSAASERDLERLNSARPALTPQQTGRGALMTKSGKRAATPPPDASKSGNAELSPSAVHPPLFLGSLAVKKEST